LWILHMDPVIRNCVFTGIDASVQGAAIWSSDSQALIEDCRFVGNDAGDSGNILFNQSFSGDNPGLLARNCSFEENQGYAIAQIQFTTAEFQDCTFRNNTAVGVVSTFGSGGLVSVSETLFCENDGGVDINGPWIDGGGNQFEDECPVGCLGDVTGDGAVNVTDLLAVISGWGDPYSVSDLLDVIAGWGACD
ncbi:MAG: right-handed parallel beta-helix repeat-containing protein, partial [Phycisphaerales bacterium]|nr:right-handed parallel beta-helix repeat-containing protein [Phycisphaerales bacterium]